MKELVQKIWKEKLFQRILAGAFILLVTLLFWNNQSNKMAEAQRATCGYQYQICKDGSCVYATGYQFYRGCIYVWHPSDGNKADKLCGEYQIKNNPFYEADSVQDDLCYCPIYGC